MQISNADGIKSGPKTRGNSRSPASLGLGAFGVSAQSIGGGGAGGLNVSGSLAATTNSTAGAVSLDLGGFGGGGGETGSVKTHVTGNVWAKAEDLGKEGAAAGGGGAGDINASGSLSLDGAVTLGVGGGGGAGAINISAGIQADKETSDPSLVFGMGGFGGAGNVSGDVDVTHNGLIVVDGKNSVGALVQSIAGGGGSGGLNVAANLSAAGKDSYAIAVGIGGSGGEGADAGDVKFTSTGDIIINKNLQQADAAAGADFDTRATNGAAILAQSIGGGGGVGGINVAGAVSRAGKPIAIGVGGWGGVGGDAGKVDVIRGYDAQSGAVAAGVVQTYGDDVKGLVAQFIGGGGGVAGANIVAGLVKEGDGSQIVANLAIGGDGGAAGSGDDVNIRHNGTILTDGVGSLGLMAQSIGGGGGNAAYNIQTGKAKDVKLVANIAIGGGTGFGGSGGNVVVDHVGDIVTLGDVAYGIIAQSIGGGGGNIKSTQAKGSFDAKTTIGVKIGRSGGEGGVSGMVDVTANGRVLTSGDRATAILAQSIGGGGGLAGSAKTSTTQNKGDEASQTVTFALGGEGGEGATADCQ